LVTVTRESKHKVWRSMLCIGQRFQTYRIISATKRFVGSPKLSMLWGKITAFPLRSLRPRRES